MHHLCLFAVGRILQNLCKFKHVHLENVVDIFRKKKIKKRLLSLDITNVVILHGCIIQIGDI